MLFMNKLKCQLDYIQNFLSLSENDIIGIFLYGSQNYGLSTQDSDVDSIVLVTNTQRLKQEITLDSGKVKVYTIPYFIERLKRGDLECYEILFTPHRILNAKYESVFANFVQKFSHCMSYDRIKRSLYIKLDEHMHYIFWMIINKDGAKYNKKRLYWAIRVCNQLERILNAESFESSLIYKDLINCDLITIKTVTNSLSVKELNRIYKYLLEFLYQRGRYSNDVSNNENDCLSDFYNKIINNKED